jgi:hypothetical protein
MSPPPCDRHKNLQMVPFPLRSPTNYTLLYVCPVTSCGRQHDEQGYFEVVEGQLVRGEGRAKQVVFGRRRTPEGHPCQSRTVRSL